MVKRINQEIFSIVRHVYLLRVKLAEYRDVTNLYLKIVEDIVRCY